MPLRYFESLGLLTALAASLLIILVAEKARADEVSISKGKIEFQSATGDFKMAVGGRAQIDFALYSDEERDDGTKVNMGDGAELRRARLTASGTVWKDWAFKAQYNFDFDGDVSAKDVWIAYKGWKPITIQVGSFQPFFSMGGLTSSNSTVFMERSLPILAFTQGHRLGGGVKSYSDLWSVAGGLFAVNDSSGADADDSLDVSVRGTFAPIATKEMVLHMGVSLSYRDYRDADPSGGKSVRLRARPESHITSVRLVSTPSFANPDDMFLYGVELGAMLGPLMARAEYIGAALGTKAYDPDADADDDEVAARDYDYGGFVFEASMMLTSGDQRSYSVKKGGVFGGVKPRAPFNRQTGGLGAWEVAVRYSNLDLKDRNEGAEQSDFSLGINWYPTNTMRFMFNYVQVLDVDGGSYDGVEPAIYQLRAQVAF